MLKVIAVPGAPGTLPVPDPLATDGHPSLNFHLVFTVSFPLIRSALYVTAPSCPSDDKSQRSTLTDASGGHHGCL